MNGALSVDAAGYRLSAPPGAFGAGQGLTIERLSTALPDIGNGRFVVPPISVKTPGQPRKPVVLEVTTSEPVDPTLTFAISWTDHGDPGLLPLEIAGTTLRAQTSHFSAFGFVRFPSQADVDKWIGDQLIGGVVRYFKNFFDFPFDCKPLQLESKLVYFYSPPPASVNLQVGYTDHPTQADTVVLQICNKLRFVMDFSMDGAASDKGFITGRVDFPLEAHVAGERGDLATFNAAFTPQAVTATLALLAVEALAHSISVDDETVQVVFNPKTITTVAAATQSCQATIAAALASSTPDPLLAAWNCLKQVEPFQVLVVDLVTAKAAKLGLTRAGATLGHVKAIMVGQTFNRVIAETWLFDLPKAYSFQLKLLCAPGRACPDPITTTTPTRAGDIAVAPTKPTVVTTKLKGSSSPKVSASPDDFAKLAVPKAPSNVHFCSVGTQDYRCWSDNSDNEDGFRIYVEGKVDEVLPANSVRANTDYDDCATSIWVVAYNEAGESSRATVPCAPSVTALEQVPAPPTGVVSFLGWMSSPESSEVKWGYPASNQAGFYIFINGRYLGTADATDRIFYLDGNADCSDNVSVSAFNHSGESQRVSARLDSDSPDCLDSATE